MAIWGTLTSMQIISYDENTPEATLYRHHRRLRWAARTCLAAGVLMMSTIAEFMISFEFYDRVAPWMNPVLIALFVVFTTVSLVLTVPMLFAFPLMEEIEQALRDRGLALPSKRLTFQDLGRSAMKMVFWAAMLVLIVHLARS